MRRPLNGFERFFCDEVGRPLGEGKAITITGVVGVRSAAAPATTAVDTIIVITPEALNVAVHTAWMRTVALFPFMRCYVDYVPDAAAASGAPSASTSPYLVERSIDEYKSDLIQSNATNSELGPLGVIAPDRLLAITSEDNDVAAFVRATQQHFAFDDAKFTAHVALAVIPPSSETPQQTQQQIALTLAVSHVGADARSAFTIMKKFLDHLETAINAEEDSINGSGNQHNNSSSPVNLFDALGFENIVKSPLRLPIVPDSFPPLVTPPAPDVPRHECSSVKIASTLTVMPKNTLDALLALTKNWQGAKLTSVKTGDEIPNARRLSIQAIFSAAGAIATLMRADPAVKAQLATSPDRALTIGVQASVQLRDYVAHPSEHQHDVLLGGSAVWLYVPIGFETTLMGLAESIHRELQVALGDGRVVGFFKMYLGGGPPPSGPPPASSQPPPPSSQPPPPSGTNSSAAVGAAVSQVSKDMIRHSATFNFTNVGLNACSDNSSSSMNPKSNVNSSNHSLFIKSLDMNLRLGTRMQPAAAFMRTHAHTLNGEFRFCVTFTEPCYSRSTAQSFGDDIVKLASSFAEDVNTALTPLPLQPLHMIVS